MQPGIGTRCPIPLRHNGECKDLGRMRNYQSVVCHTQIIQPASEWGKPGYWGRLKCIASRTRACFSPCLQAGTLPQWQGLCNARQGRKDEGVETMAELTSQRYEVKDMAEAIELYYAKGWTDGFPVVPPTENSIWAMLESAGLEPEAEITFIENRQVSVTAEKVAINTVMAGCKPEYMPVIVAAVEALGDPRCGYQ